VVVLAAGRKRQVAWASLAPMSITWQQRRRLEHTCKVCQAASTEQLTNCLSLTMHNVHHLLSLMKAARHSIIEDGFPRFVYDFFARYYEGKPVPSWAVSALEVVGITLTEQNSEL